jgi:excisionase family DNA binding protein
MTRQTAATNGGRDGNHTAERPDPSQSRHWDLDLLTPDDVCALLKVKKSWLYDTVENGALEAIRLGKQLRFRPSALLRYLDERVSNGNGRGGPSC